MAEIRCPSCGESESSGGSFEIQWDTMSTYSGDARTEDGVLQYPTEWSEVTFSRKVNPRLVCGDCGHAWPTKRRIEN